MTEAIDKPDAPPPPSSIRRYHVELTAKQVLARLSEQAGVQAYDRQSLPDFAGLNEGQGQGPDSNASEYTLEFGEHDFRLHCGPPAVRGQSGTGMLRMLYLVGRMTPSEYGTEIELRFAWHRPRWALQRWVGFLALASLGLFWVLAGPGVLAKKALLYGLLLAVVAPVLAHDLRRDDKHEDQRKALLNLLERVLGPLQISDTPADEPYRKRLRERQPDDDDSQEDSED